MNNVVAYKPNQVSDFRPEILKLIKSTIAKDCNDLEFNQFIALCQAYGLNPLRKEIHCVIYNKKDADKRSMALITSIDGYRVIAERTGRYRPDEDPPRFEYDAQLKSDLNPLGLVSATVSVWKMDSLGQWHKSSNTAYWDEYAPIENVWENGRLTDKKKLKDNWFKMGRIMLSKCAESLSMRKAFPDAFSGLYTDDEMEKTQASSLASDIIHKDIAERHNLNTHKSITVQLDKGDDLQAIPVGQFADTVLREAKSWVDPRQASDFNQRNKAAIKLFWGECPTDALELKKELEKIELELIEKEKANG